MGCRPRAWAGRSQVRGRTASFRGRWSKPATARSVLTIFGCSPLPVRLQPMTKSTESCGATSRLSGAVRRIGLSASPLPLDEFLRLRESIGSTAAGGTSPRVNLPPVILSCSRCAAEYVRPAYEVSKSIRRGLRDRYCSIECSRAHHAIKNRRKCEKCGSPTPRKTMRYCPGCRPARTGRPAMYAPIRRDCPTCQATFLSRWMGRRAGKHQVYCSRTCAGIGHSARMAGRGNPKWKHGATPLRQQPHSARAFRLMRPNIILRDGGACVVCKDTAKLHVHHLDDWPMNNAATNLVTLCARCHRKWHAAKDSKPSRTLWPWLIEYPVGLPCSISKSPRTTTSSLTGS